MNSQMTLFEEFSIQDAEKIMNDPSNLEVIKQIDLSLNYFNDPTWFDNLAFDPNESWVQTYSGIRFTPLKPDIRSICIQDIAHALSHQCRFGGHSKEFYSVAQHSVLVSYLCDEKDALHGLLHDASEAYLVDVPRPLKQSGKFDNYLLFEKELQSLIFKRFNLSKDEPFSVKKADGILLAMEARDLLKNMRKDFVHQYEPLPFKIEALTPNKAKDLFLKRFFTLYSNIEQFNKFKTKDIF